MSSIPQSPQISSPATSQAPIVEQSFHKGQSIALILNRTDLIPGIISRVNPDLTFDLECQVPIQVRKMTWKGKPGQSEYTIRPVFDLETRPFLRALPIDPRMQVVKVVTSLQDLGMNTIEDKARGHVQTAISMWRDSGRRNRIPRLTEFYAPLVGRFFDPSLYYYRVNCWRAAMDIRGEGRIPEEYKTFPNQSKTPPYYVEFTKCFKRYAKEYLSNLEKWNRVQMEAILPEDVEAAAIEGD